MSSIALYRRYRPRRFEDVLGQEHVTETLQAAIRDERVAHAYLFSGARGTGKTSTARILAKALNCEKGPTPAPCNECDSCRAISGGSSLDVIEIDAASHGGVDDVRDLRENALLAPALARRKIYIIDEAHMVTTQGWNAFLKTVEEPPDHVIFVFATTEPHRVLPTILSRCQRFDFRRVSSTTIAEHLAKVAADEGIETDEGALQLIARHAEGGVRDALSTLDQLSSTGVVSVKETARLLGAATTDLLFEFSDALDAADTGAAVSILARLVEEGHDLRVFARTVLDHVRALLLTKQVPDPGDLIDATDETRARLTTQAEGIGAARLLHWTRLFVDALTDMRQQAPPRLTLELAVVRATMPEVDDTAAAAIARIERLERLLGSSLRPGSASQAPAEEATLPAEEATLPTGEAPGEATPRAKPPARKGKRAAASVTEDPPAPAAPPETQPPAEGLLDIEKLRRSWAVVLEEVRTASKRVHSYLMDATPVGFDGSTLTLEHRFPFHARELMEPKNARVIAAGVNAVFGVSPRIAASVRSGGEQPEEAAETPAGTEAADPLDVLKAGFGDDLQEE